MSGRREEGIVYEWEERKGVSIKMGREDRW